MAKPTIEITTDKNNTTRLWASGELSAQHSSEVKLKYLEVLNLSSNVHLAFEEVTAFDVAALQLTYLLKKEVEQKGRTITLALPQTAVLKTVLEKSSVNKIL